MKRNTIRDLISKPLIYSNPYSWLQRLIGFGSGQLLDQQLKAACSEADVNVLDVGCGPRPMAPWGNGTLTGIDLNLFYLPDYKRYGKESGNWVTVQVVCGLAQDLPFKTGSFGECRCMGVLHHLSQLDAETCLQEIKRVTRVGGQILIFDSVLPINNFLNPFAWLIRKLDRGAYVRTQSKLEGLIAKLSARSCRITRFTYTLTGLEGILAIIET